MEADLLRRVSLEPLALRAPGHRPESGHHHGPVGRVLRGGGGVSQRVLADLTGCLRGGVIANVVVPTGDYVRFATHFGFRPDFCEAADPESRWTDDRGPATRFSAPRLST